MAIIETNWDVPAKDVRLFSTIGTVVFGALTAGKLAGIAALAHYADKLLSWPLLAAAAALCLVGTSLKGVPRVQKPYGIFGAVLLGAVAGALYGGLLAPQTWMFIALTGVFLLGATGATALVRPVYLAALIATFPLGMVLGPVILGVIYFVVFTPVAVFFRLIGRDTMQRRFDDAAPSYWIERRPAADVKRYFRQF